jgi:hypothetical protein
MRTNKINNFRLFESLNYGTWISCDEQLPKDGQNVLIFNTSKSIEVGTFVSIDDPRLYFRDFKDEYYNQKPYGWDTGGKEIDPGQLVTHWMTLPEKPKNY